MLTKTKTNPKRKNPAIGLKTDSNKLIEALEDTKITLSDPSSRFFEQDLKEERIKIGTLATEVVRKMR